MVELKQSEEKYRGELPQRQIEYTAMKMITVRRVKSLTYSLQWSKKGSGGINVASLRLPFILSLNTASRAEQRCYYISDPKNEPLDLLTFNPTRSHAAILPTKRPGRRPHSGQTSTREDANFLVIQNLLRLNPAKQSSR